MPLEPLSLTILRQQDTITMDFHEATSVVSRMKRQVTEDLLAEISARLDEITTLSNQRAALRTDQNTGQGALPDDLCADLRCLGAFIFAHLFPRLAREKLTRAAATALFLRLDDQLVHVPWELAFDGTDFLLDKFRIGRQVITNLDDNPHDCPPPAALPDRLSMLILADPTADLPAAREEARALGALFAPYPQVHFDVLTGPEVRRFDILRKLSTYDLIHYAGHARFDPDQPGQSGWILRDGVLTATEIHQGQHRPLLVFSNACRAGATTSWQADTPYARQAFGIGSASYSLAPTTM
jgi:hypothetical protein